MDEWNYHYHICYMRMEKGICKNADPDSVMAFNDCSADLPEELAFGVFTSMGDFSGRICSGTHCCDPANLFDWKADAALGFWNFKYFDKAANHSWPE